MPFVIVAFLVVVIFVGVWASKERQGIGEQAAENSVSLLIVPQANGNEAITTNTQFTREVVIHNPSGVQIVNYELALSFPPSLLEVVSIDTSMSPLPTEVFSTFDNVGGKIRLLRVDIGQAPTTLESFSIGRITFKARASSGVATVGFTQQIVSGTETGSTVIVQLQVESVQNGSYVLTVGPTPSMPTATPTIVVPTAIPTTVPPTQTPTLTPTTVPPTPTATATPIISTMPTTVFLTTTAFLLQGRDYAGASQSLPVFVKIKNTTNEWNTRITDGIISNLPLTNTIPGVRTLTVKPDGYLAREIAQTLVTGQNTISLNSILFCAGDIDGNGIVNSFDYSELLRDYGKTSGRSDLDGSGQVNSLDFSLLLSNFSETPSTQECEQ